ncbi:YraN family protein [Patescibacteria group bacterium]|nr:YraN family protein [Patescibacteria group bacterium]
MNNKKVGSVGEKIAVIYLRKKGYEVLKRNWYCHWGEIDIVCFHPKRGYVFTEVKYVRDSRFILPEDLFTHKKIQHLLRTIDFFLEGYKKIDKWCLDLICIRGVYGDIKIRHYRDVGIT